MPKATAASLSSKRRHNPLEDDLVATGVLKNREGRPSKRADRKQAEEQAYVDAKASRKILAMSRDLIDEEELRSGANDQHVSAPSAFDFDPSRLEGGSDEEEEEFANEEAWGDEEDVVEEIEVDADDLDTFNRFITPTMNDDPLLAHGWDRKPGDGAEEQGAGTNLADLILAKIAEKEAMQGGRQQQDYNPIEEDYEMPPKVVEVFTKYVCMGWVCRLTGDESADVLLGSGSFLLATSPGHCRNRSRSCHKSPTGKTSFKSHAQTFGMCMSNIWIAGEMG
jgi:essential nuclear protein 1